MATFRQGFARKNSRKKKQSNVVAIRRSTSKYNTDVLHLTYLLIKWVHVGNDQERANQKEIPTAKTEVGKSKGENTF